MHLLRRRHSAGRPSRIDPTPDEIEQRAAAIRRTWTDARRAKAASAATAYRETIPRFLLNETMTNLFLTSKLLSSLSADQPADGD